MKRLFAGVGVLLLLLSVLQTKIGFGPLLEKNPEIEWEDELSDSPEKYEEYFLDRITMDGKESHGYSHGYRIKELQKLANNNLRTQGTKAITWSDRGPSNVPGRTRGLVILPGDPTGNSWIIGSAGGGIWKTTNSGGSWANKTPDLANLATSVIALSESNPNVLYAGTGEGFNFSSAIKGDGIFKSTDAGESWTQLSSTAGDVRFQNINAIIVDPLNPDILLTCSNGFPPFASDILKSTDGGTTWTEVYNGGTRIQQIIADPTDFNIQYASINNAFSIKGILKSTDAGDTWVLIGNGILADGRISIAISPVNTQRLYAVGESLLNASPNFNAATDPLPSEIFFSDDGGENWLVLGEEDRSKSPDWLGGQGFFGNSIQAHPFDKDIVYTGGVDMYKAVVVPGTFEKLPKLLGVQEIGTKEFMAFINSGLSQLGGGLGTGEEWFQDHEGFPTDRESDDFRAVEIRFGPGKSQKAHRFIVDPNDGTANDGGAGVPPLGYLYQDYVDVPFEVWDIDNNQQLMVSFRDQERDGAWNLIERDADDPVPGREYIMVSPVTYADTEDSNIAKNGGQGYKLIYSMWPTLAENAVFDPDNLPDSKLFINYGPLIVQKSTHVRVNNSGGVFTPGFDGVHPDIHNIQFHSTAPGTFKIVVASDGGMYFSNEEAVPGESNDDWAHAFNGNNTTQFYSIDKANGQSKYIGGTQDNGTWVNENINANATTRYLHKIGGDGFDAIWNYGDANQLIGSAQHNSFQRSDDGGISWVNSRSGLDDIGSTLAPFFSVLENHKALPDILYTVGVTGVWKSTNFGENWSSKPISSKWVFEDETGTKFISSSHTVVSSKANPNIVWAGGGMTTTRNMHVTKNRGSSFSIVPNVADTLGSISGFATHPTEENTAYVLFSFAQYGKIFRTKDLGGSWQDISGFNGGTSSTTGFPDVAINTLLVLPHEPTTIWVGTEIGVMESTDDGASWHSLDGNIPKTSIWQLRALDDQVLAATHGRGIWTATFPTMDWPGDLEVITGIENKKLSSFATLYPNPADRSFSISYSNSQPGKALINIIQTDGRVVLKKEVQLSASGIIEIETSTLPSGIFILNLQRGHINYSARLVVQH